MTKKTVDRQNNVKRRFVIDTHGRRRLVHVVDSESPTLGQDLEHVFRLNVAKARRENKRILGVADFLPGKH
jgi:hypothetical protein